MDASTTGGSKVISVQLVTDARVWCAEKKSVLAAHLESYQFESVNKYIWQMVENKDFSLKHFKYDYSMVNNGNSPCSERCK